MGSPKAIYGFHTPAVRALACAVLLVAASAAGAKGLPGSEAPQAVRDAWIDGRLETAYALNPQLGQFEIDTSVEAGVVRLAGELGSEIDRKLAIRIARDTDGVREVRSDLTSSEAAPVAALPTDPDAERTFSQKVHDATASARVQSNLVANGNTKDLSIDVDTRNDVVTLKGAVPSRKDKMLAEMIARNTDGIANVRNQLEIDEQT